MVSLLFFFASSFPPLPSPLGPPFCAKNPPPPPPPPPLAASGWLVYGKKIINQVIFSGEKKGVEQPAVRKEGGKEGNCLVLVCSQCGILRRGEKKGWSKDRMSLMAKKSLDQSFKSASSPSS